MQAQTTPGVCQCGCGGATAVVKGRPNRFIHGHNWRGVSRTAVPRYVEEDRGYDSRCWIWQRHIFDGYGRDGGRHAHREVYQELCGEIPDGHELHHLCGNTSCVNPSHLLPVTRQEHARRGGMAARTHCIHGHPYDEENTYVYPSTGHRRCRQCHREEARRRKAAS